MTAPNRSTLWGRTLVDELAAGGLEAVCLAPGSRSTPLTVAFADHPDVDVFSHLDERAAAFFALGRGRRTGDPTALVCTSGTAAANFHPAVIEADRGRVPLLVLTADRPPELRDSGANQTIDQTKLYGDATRWYADLPEPEAGERKVRMLRTTAARALGRTTGTPAGPVHLNCPFSKPLEPTPVAGDVPEDFSETLAGRGREGPFVDRADGRPALEADGIDRLADALADAKRPLMVAGPADPPGFEPSPAVDVATAVGAPILADPLSSLRFGPHVADAPICGGYDAYLGAAWPDPDVVIRIGASPTSKILRKYLRDADCRQFLLDPAGGWREATFTATDLVAADPDRALASVADVLESSDGDGRSSGEAGSSGTGADPEHWLERYRRAENRHWTLTDEAREQETFEGAILAATVEHAPDPATLVVSNSMPVRDADRFGRPRTAALTVLGNRGASGIDGVTSTALGAGSATDDPLVLVTGDLAFYHDLTGLLASERCGVDATIVVIDNDGGGIFHMLPIEGFDPPFTDQFKTPHGLEFDALADLYDLTVDRVEPSAFESTYRQSLASEGTQVLSVGFDAEASHRTREALRERVREEFTSGR